MKEINEVKQPEVDDVWEDARGYRCRIIVVANDVYKANYSMGDKKEAVDFGVFTTESFKRCKYIGKAKNPITSIFEVE